MSYRFKANGPISKAWELHDLTDQERRVVIGIEALMVMARTTADAWYYNPKTKKKIKRNFGEVIALMHSELSEALEADRKSLMSDKVEGIKGQEEEFADVFIRIADTSEEEHFDLAYAIIMKNRYNQEREDHKLQSRAKKGGKKY